MRTFKLIPATVVWRILGTHLVIIFTMLLAACAGVSALPGSPAAAGSKHTRKTAMAQLHETPVCCGSFADFHFKQDLPAHPQPINIGPGRPVANFNGTRSYFASFKLPTHHTLPYSILLKSDLSGGHWLHSSYLFAPSVVLLDSRYRLLRTKDVHLCEYMGWTSATSGAFGSVTVNNPGARYLVIYSSGRQLRSSTYWEQSPANFSASEPVQMASSGSYQIPHGPNGRLYVGMLTPRYEDVLSEAICGKPRPSSGGVLSTLRSIMQPSQPQTGR